MNLGFLEATKILEASNSLGARDFVLAASGQTEKLDVFLKAISIKNGFNSEYRVLPFGTFHQYIAGDLSAIDKVHVFIMFPWDLIALADWRSGVYVDDIDFDLLLNDAIEIINSLQRFRKKIIYIPACIPPISLNNSSLNIFIEKIKLLMMEEGAVILDSSVFCLSSYLANGCPFSSRHLSEVSLEVVKALLPVVSSNKKLLVTDFDNVMWKGSVGEDGVEGVRCFNEGAGYVHYIYQSYLLKLKQAGVLIAGVTRNDISLAKAPFVNDVALLNESDFVAIIASYNAKSSQIRTLITQLNIMPENVVFVDDNPIEIEEVMLKIPQVDCVLFPERNIDFVSFLNKLVSYFDISKITTEDRKRTDLYLSRNLQVIPSRENGADLYDYLSSLDMKSNVIECDSSNITRALQLINKTNQFNLNGGRIDEQELLSLFEKGFRLFSFTLSDNYVDHGQVLCILVDNKNLITHFVMSCRVFQRRLEYCCLLWLVDYLNLSDLELDYVKTKYNSPYTMFIESEGFSIFNKVLMNVDVFKKLNAHSSGLIKISKIQ